MTTKVTVPATISIGAQSLSVSAVIDITSLAAAVAAILAPAPPVTPAPPVVTPPPVVVPPVVIPPTAGVPHLDYIVYQNGAFNGPSNIPPGSPIGTQSQPDDDSWGMASRDFWSTVNPYPGHQTSVRTVLSDLNGGYQPLFVPNGATSFFDSSSYSTLLVSACPANAGAGFWIGFAGNLDTAAGVQIQVAGPGMTKYGPVPVAGKWADYRIPLADFQMTAANRKALFKFGVACGGVPVGSAQQFDNVGLVH